MRARVDLWNLGKRIDFGHGRQPRRQAYGLRRFWQGRISAERGAYLSEQSCGAIVLPYAGPGCPAGFARRATDYVLSVLQRSIGLVRINVPKARPEDTSPREQTAGARTDR